MSSVKMNFVNSEYFVPEQDNWHLKEGAPEEIKKEFENIYALIQSNDDRIERTNRRVDKYEKTLEQIREATNLGMHNDLVILRHLATNNNTGEINETIQDVENWLINRKI